MRAALLDAPGRPLRIADVPDPEPESEHDVLIDVHACGVCRTDLHIADGELRQAHTPLILGHQVVGTRTDTGERVGVPWLARTDGTCAYCASGRENLCDRAEFTGLDRDGGFAERVVADGRFCLPLPEGPADDELAPLLCGGLIGFRTLRLAGDPQRLGIYGFGAAAHIVCQVASWEGREVFAFTKPGDTAAQDLARAVGATWAGGSDEHAPDPLDAALIFAPAGELVPLALRAVRKGGAVVCGGIHMSDIPSFPYAWLWGERTLRSVANLTRADGRAFLDIAPRVPVRTHVTRYPLDAAQQALDDLRSGALAGAAVITMPKA
jgi:propanol-preferring alcohol dehydrogenase